MRSLCGEVGPGDGDDPRLAKKETPPSRSVRKARQLCAQVMEALGYALAATADDQIAGLSVASVEPASDCTRLLITVAPPRGEHPYPGDLLDRLERATPRLRLEVAQSITRRRAPVLSFRISLVE